MPSVDLPRRLYRHLPSCSSKPPGCLFISPLLNSPKTLVDPLYPIDLSIILITNLPVLLTFPPILCLLMTHLPSCQYQAGKLTQVLRLRFSQHDIAFPCRQLIIMCQKVWCRANPKIIKTN